MHSCSVDEAFGVLRSYCRNHSLGLSEVAGRVVAEPRGFLDRSD